MWTIAIAINVFLDVMLKVSVYRVQCSIIN